MIDQQALETCLRNQAECAAYRGPDMAGAWAGLCDWLGEECLILLDASRGLSVANHGGLESLWALDCREWKEVRL